jgi:membrane protease subunit HflK
MSQADERWLTRQEGAALVSCAVNLVLTVAKFILFVTLVRSVSLQAEAWHSLSDIGSSFVVFLALFLPRRKRGKVAMAGPEEAGRGSSGLFSGPGEPEPPEVQVEQEGPRARQAKPEDFVAISIACLFIVVAIGIFVEIIQPQPMETDYALPVACGMLAMGYASYLLYRFEYQVGMESDSPGLIADGYHSKIDMYGSLLVAAALVSHRIGLPEADRIIAGVICLGILAHSIEVLAMAARHYLGKPVSAAEGVRSSALTDVYALTGRWGRQVSDGATRLLARLLCIDRSGPEPGRRVARRLLLIGILAAGILYGLSGLYACGPEEEAFVERFGRPTTKTPYGPGLHYHWPWPFERAVRRETKRIRRFALGTPVESERQPILWTNRHYRVEYRYLTGDENFVSSYLVVHYRIRDFYKYRYLCADPEAMLENACRAKFRELSGISAFFDCLTTKRRAIEQEIQQSLSRTVAPFGIEVVLVAIRDLHPPTDVAPAFEAVISAEEERETLVNEARAFEVGAVPLAEGQGAGIRADARAYRQRKLDRAGGDISAFVALQEQYVVSPAITRVQMYLEMMEATIAQTPKWVVLGDGREAPLELWFPKGGTYWRWTLEGFPEGEKRE